MTDAAYSRAIAGYQAASRMALTPGDMALALHQKLYAAISSARYADEQNRLDEMVLQLGVASQILSALKMNMDFSSAGADGQQLQRFYARMHRMVLRMGIIQKRHRKWEMIADPIQTMVKLMMNNSSLT